MYHHTQRAPLYWMFVVPGIVMLVVSGFLADPQASRFILAAAGAFLLVVSTSFGQLTVRDETEHLLIQFGPLPLFRRRLSYKEIEDAQRARTAILDGWGIHLSPRGGWTWNLWGFDCVDVALRGGRSIHIGTDDPDGLASFLRQRITAIAP
jgi:hypothetical protein